MSEKLTEEEMVELFGEGYENETMTFTIAPGQTREEAIEELKTIMNLIQSGYYEALDSFD